MELTAEQQFQLDLENARNANQMAMQNKQAKLEAVRIAQQTLIENRRNMPVGEREITAADITSYANSIVSYVNS